MSPKATQVIEAHTDHGQKVTIAPDVKEDGVPVPAPPKQAPKSDASQPPRSTTADPWKNLHPARVWPD